MCTYEIRQCVNVGISSCANAWVNKAIFQLQVLTEILNGKCVDNGI